MNRIARGLVAPLLWLALSSVLHAAPAAKVVGADMTLPADERAVKVTFFRAPGEAPRPSVLLLHGAGGFERRLAEYKRYAADLADAGMDAYLVNYYSAADQRALAFGVSTFEKRYRAWAKLVGDLAAYLTKQTGSNGKVGLVGFSNGGILASGAATLDPNIAAAVIYYGTDPWPLGKRATRYPPLLILHGDADQIIPVAAGRQLAAEAKALGARVDLVIYPGESHGFGADFAKKNALDAQQRTIAFLKKELQ